MPTPPPFVTSAPLICLNAASAKPADVRAGRENGARMLRRPSQLTSVGCPKMNEKKFSGKMGAAFARSAPNAREVRRGSVRHTLH